MRDFSLFSNLLPVFSFRIQKTSELLIFFRKWMINQTSNLHYPLETFLCFSMTKNYWSPSFMTFTEFQFFLIFGNFHQPLLEQAMQSSVFKLDTWESEKVGKVVCGNTNWLPLVLGSVLLACPLLPGLEPLTRDGKSQRRGLSAWSSPGSKVVEKSVTKIQIIKRCSKKISSFYCYRQSSNFSVKLSYFNR